MSNPFDLPDVDPALEDDLRSGLEAVEKRLQIAAESADSFVAEAAAHLLEAGGKRFRPLLALLAAQFGDPRTEQVIDAAAVVELTHLATLYHDDVMDEAPMRRGAQSANDRYGNVVAILTGDFLFARASDILADLGTEAVRIQARTFERLVAGQILETVGPAEGRDPVEHYLRVIADKTGSLIATSGLFGAMFSGASPEVAEVLRQYGEEIGVAFQLSDDILDIASESVESGKTPGTDLREGVPTLPVLYTLASDDADAARVRELIGPSLTQAQEADTSGSRASDTTDTSGSRASDTTDANADARIDETNVDARIDEALRILRTHSGMDQARADLARRAQYARELLAPLPDIPAKDALAALTDLVVSRSS